MHFLVSLQGLEGLKVWKLPFVHHSTISPIPGTCQLLRFGRSFYMFFISAVYRGIKNGPTPFFSIFIYLFDFFYGNFPLLYVRKLCTAPPPQRQFGGPVRYISSHCYYYWTQPKRCEFTGKSTVCVRAFLNHNNFPSYSIKFLSPNFLCTAYARDVLHNFKSKNAKAPYRGRGGGGGTPPSHTTSPPLGSLRDLGLGRFAPSQYFVLSFLIF